MPSAESIGTGVAAGVTAAQNYATGAIEDVGGFLDELRSVAKGQNPPQINISPQYFVPSEIVIGEAEPERPAMDFSGLPLFPSEFIPDLITISPAPAIGSLNVPSLSQFSWNEEEYVSSLLTSVKNKIKTGVDNGGTGLAADVEDAIYDRAKERELENRDLELQDTSEKWAAMGFGLPNGILSKRLSKVMRQFTDNRNTLSRTIMTDQAKLAQENTHFMLKAGSDLESVLIQHHDNVKNRALTAARSVVELGVLYYNAMVTRFTASLEGVKVQAEVDQTRAKLQTELSNQKLQAFLGNITAYRTRTDSFLEKIKTMAQVYGVDVQKYAASVGKGEAMARITVAQQEMATKNLEAQVQGQIQQAIANLQAFVQMANVRMSAASAGGQIYSHAVSGALQSISTLQSIGYTGSVTGEAT